MADATTLKDVVKELKETNKKNDKLLRETGKFQKATQGTGGFLGALVERTQGVPLLGGFFRDIDETVGKMQDGISATKRLIGIGGDETNKRLAEIAGMSVKDFKEIEKDRQISKAKAATEDALFKATVEHDADLQEFYDELTDDQKRAIAANDKGQVELLKAIKNKGEASMLLEQLEEIVEQGKETIALEEKAIEDRADEARERDQQQMSMRERMSELFSSFKDKVGAAKGIGGKAKAIMKSGGEMVKNMFGEMFGTLGATALMSMSGLTKSFAKGAAKMMRGLMTRALAFMSPPVIIAMAVVGLLAYFKDDIIKWFKKMWSAISNWFSGIDWGGLVKKAIKFSPLGLLFTLGKKIWGAVTGFFENFNISEMISKISEKGLGLLKWVGDLKDKIVNGLKMFILKIVPETFFRYPLRAKVAEMMGVTLPGSGKGDEEVVDKHKITSAKIDENFADNIKENALAKTGSKRTTNVITKGGDNNSTNVNNQTSVKGPAKILNYDPVLNHLLYGV